MIPNPLSPYAAGKLAGEHYVRVYARTMGLDGVSLRYFNVFGPRQDPSSPYSGVISLFARLMAEGRRPVIYGDGSQTRDFTYVANVVRANLLALDAPGPLGGEALNVGTGRRISLLDLVAAINRALGTDLEPEFRPARAGDVRDSQASLDRIRAVLGYEPSVDFEEGLRRTLGAVVVTGQGGDDHRGRLLAAIEGRTARVGIIGLGYVGLPLARAFAEAGYRRPGVRHRPGQGRAAGPGRELHRPHPRRGRSPRCSARGSRRPTGSSGSASPTPSSSACRPR